MVLDESAGNEEVGDSCASAPIGENNIIIIANATAKLRATILRVRAKA